MQMTQPEWDALAKENSSNYGPSGWDWSDYVNATGISADTIAILKSQAK